MYLYFDIDVDISVYNYCSMSQLSIHSTCPKAINIFLHDIPA